MPTLNFEDEATEAETRFIMDKGLIKKGWDYELGTLRLEKTLGANGFDEQGKPYKLNGGRVDYLLRIKYAETAQPIPIAIIEAKRRNSAVYKGLQQVIQYARFHHVVFVYATNGDQFVEHNCQTGITSEPQPMAAFPSHDDLLARHNELDTAAPHYRVLTTPYTAQESETIRYYQDAAIRAILEKITQCEQDQKPKRALLSLATGTGKTRLASNLLKRISEAGLLDKALFICDRDELRTQGHTDLNRLFSTNAQMVTGQSACKNAKVLVATYQTLGIENEDNASFLERNYPEDYFSHIIIDECHRSGFGKWSTVLKRNPNAVQIGLTATPRQIKRAEGNQETTEDEQISADNYRHFGEPVYQYDLSQAVEDGYLSACEIIQNHVLLMGEDENKGLLKQNLSDVDVKNYFSGEPLTTADLKEKYHAVDLDARIILPERTNALCSSLFAYLLASGAPEQKTIIFCAGVDHARRVASQLNNLYAIWCQENGQDRLDKFAFICTGEEGKDNLTDFKGAERSHFIATTADLLQAGVDVPWVRNIVFFAHIKSAIRFYQMVGRGTRLHAQSEKISFKIYDYTNATRLFGEEFLSKQSKPKQTPQPQQPPIPPPTPEPPLEATKLLVTIIPTDPLFMIVKDGKHTRVSFADYRDHVKGLILEQLPTVDDFVQEWLDASAQLLAMPSIQTIIKHKDQHYDSFDLLADLIYDVTPKTKHQRLTDFLNNSAGWLITMPEQSANTLRALGEQFEIDGTEGINNGEVFNVQRVKKASGGSPFKALSLVGRPNEIVREFKARIFRP